MCQLVVASLAQTYLALDADEEGDEKRSTSVTFLVAAAAIAPPGLILLPPGEVESDFLMFFFPILSFIFLT